MDSQTYIRRLALVLLILVALLALGACQAEGTELPAPPPTPASDEGEREVTIGQAMVTAVSATPTLEDEVIVTISGEHPDGCTTLHETSTSYADQTYTIDLSTSRPTDMLCTQQIVPFAEEVTLDISNRPNGAYTVIANGVETSFTLGGTTTPGQIEPTVTISPTTGGPGTVVNLTAAGLAAEIPVEIGLGLVNSEYDVIETSKTTSNGELETMITFPDFAYEEGEWVFVVATPTREKYVSNVFTVTAADVTRVDVYLIAVGDDGAHGPRVGCGDSLVPITVDIGNDAEGPLLLDALKALLSLNEQTQPDTDLYNALNQSDLSVSELELESGRATIYLQGELLLGGACDVPRVEAQLRQTVLQFASVNDVTYYINGNLLEDLLDVRG
jgi:hypothetical protein